MKQLINKIDNFATSAFTNWQVPGAAIGIVQGGEIIHLKGYGQKGIDNPDPVTPECLFPVASITKAMSAAAIALLVEDGHFNWHQKVVEILPDFKMYDPWVTKEYTVIDLFCHRSGLGFDPMQQLPLWGYSAQTLKNFLCHVKPSTSFRTTYQYINILYLFVQDIIEKFSGISFSDFMEQRLFKPLGMHARIGFCKERASQLVQGQVLDEETFTKIRTVSFSCYPHVHMAAGGVVTSGADLCKWMQAQLGHIPFLRKSSIGFMWRPQTVISSDEFYGLGWRILTHKPQRIISHGGLIKGVRHLLYIVPQSDFGIFVLTNLTHSEVPLMICEFAADLLIGIKPREYASDAREKYLNSLKADLPPQILDISFEPSTYTGNYTNAILGTARIACDDGQLKLYLGPKPAVALLQPIAPDRFRLFFTADSGADIAEGHWGTAVFKGNTLTIKAHQRFDGEEFIFCKT